MSPTDFATLAAMAVAAGLGAVVRFLLATRLNRDLPVGTLLANLVAAAALGFVASAPSAVVTVVGIGALGALSTWSTAANEAATLSRGEHGLLGVGYLILSVSSGVLAAWFGLRLGSAVFA